MATKNEVIKSINTIIDNGNNTAAKVRNVLTDILDFTENLPQTASGGEAKLFSFSGNVGDNKKTAILSYSFRGIQAHHVNFTLLFEYVEKEDSGNPVFEFSLKEEEIKILSEIINVGSPDEVLNFAVPLQSKDRELTAFRSLRMGVSISKTEKLVLDFQNGKNVKFSTEDKVHTSIHLHSIRKG